MLPYIYIYIYGNMLPDDRVKRETQSSDANIELYIYIYIYILAK